MARLRLTRDSLQLGVFFVLAGGTAAALLLTSMAKKAAKVEFEQRRLGEGGGEAGAKDAVLKRFPGLE
jgi:hypothetical protein